MQSPLIRITNLLRKNTCRQNRNEICRIEHLFGLEISFIVFELQIYFNDFYPPITQTQQ